MHYILINGDKFPFLRLSSLSTLFASLSYPNFPRNEKRLKAHCFSIIGMLFLIIYILLCYCATRATENMRYSAASLEERRENKTSPHHHQNPNVEPPVLRQRPARVRMPSQQRSMQAPPDSTPTRRMGMMIAQRRMGIVGGARVQARGRWRRGDKLSAAELLVRECRIGRNWDRRILMQAHSWLSAHPLLESGGVAGTPETQISAEGKEIASSIQRIHII